MARQDQTSSCIVGAVVTPQPLPAIQTSKFGFGAGKSWGDRMAVSGQSLHFVKMAKLEFESKEKTAEQL